MDPLSIAGLTIAVLDQLWKIGEGTAQLVSNFRDFDSVRLLSYPSNNFRTDIEQRSGLKRAFNAELTLDLRTPLYWSTKSRMRIIGQELFTCSCLRLLRLVIIYLFTHGTK